MHQRLARCQAQAAVLAVALTHELPARARAGAARLNAAQALPFALASTGATAPLTPTQRQGQLGRLGQLQGDAAEWHTHNGAAPPKCPAPRAPL
ncbi:hypothetical protein [Hymenobacter terricola]|uniref:hypothetical protein n=1 Tax=Hymenobacter terricola TaxID=2819236 RepID=UPI001B3084B4|nr:hypothetical protein [Hymenobacter terricola]